MCTPKPVELLVMASSHCTSDLKTFLGDAKEILHEERRYILYDDHKEATDICFVQSGHVNCTIDIHIFNLVIFKCYTS